jgi:hypothetical protein
MITIILIILLIANLTFLIYKHFADLPFKNATFALTVSIMKTLDSFTEGKKKETPENSEKEVTECTTESILDTDELSTTVNISPEPELSNDYRSEVIRLKKNDALFNEIIRILTLLKEKGDEKTDEYKYQHNLLQQRAIQLERIVSDNLTKKI